ncbi:MAG: hypothetical protein GQ570_03855 [Helicobacteraceae bacterium]|nr:hypothetical protein [Helicobacteraceae bacterium]
MVTVQLVRAARYNNASVTYLRGVPMQVSDKLAKTLLAETDQRDVPYFKTVETTEEEETGAQGDSVVSV